ncbi:MAG: glycoside hydrolase family 88 protein, partial [Pedobacter sp.]
MKKSLLILAIACGFSHLLFAQSIPAKKEILASMRLANTYFMNKWPDAGKTIITNKERPSSIWTRGVYYEGLMALHATETKKAKKKTYYDYAVQWGEKHKWSLNGGIKTRNADNHCA